MFRPFISVVAVTPKAPRRGFFSVIFSLSMCSALRFSLRVFFQTQIFIKKLFEYFFSHSERSDLDGYFFSCYIFFSCDIRTDCRQFQTTRPGMAVAPTPNKKYRTKLLYEWGTRPLRHSTPISTTKFLPPLCWSLCNKPFADFVTAFVKQFIRWTNSLIPKRDRTTHFQD